MALDQDMGKGVSIRALQRLLQVIWLHYYSSESVTNVIFGAAANAITGLLLYLLNSLMNSTSFHSTFIKLAHKDIHYIQLELQ